jgi:hypothetical protein
VLISHCVFFCPLLKPKQHKKVIKSANFFVYKRFINVCGDVEGFIAKIGESGVLVVFYNEMKVRKGEVASLHANPFAQSPGQVKIMKEFV